MIKFTTIIKLKKTTNFSQKPWVKILYKKYIKPLKDVKHEKNPLKIIFSFEILNLFAATNPKKNEPIVETIKLLFIKTLKKVAT